VHWPPLLDRQRGLEVRLPSGRGVVDHKKGITMENASFLGRDWGAVLVVALFAALLAGPAGCAHTAGRGGEAVARMVWQGRDQFVAIEKQDPSPNNAAANEHPVDIPAGRLRDALATVDVSYPDQDGEVPLFHDQELQILGNAVSKGLASAGPDEDVTFAVIGQRALLDGFLKERKVTTGRVFCRKGRLNFIFGDVLRDVKENEDRRLHPLLMGSQSITPPHDWALAAKPGSAGFTMERPDWITFPLAPPETPGAVSPLPPEVGAAARKPPGTVAPVLPGSAPAKPGIAERLMLLNDLRGRRLITDEEYRRKRQQILDGL